MFFLTKGEGVEVGDVFYQEGPKLFVLRNNRSESNFVNDISEDDEHGTQDLDNEADGMADGTVPSKVVREGNNGVAQSSVSKKQKERGFFPKPQVKGFLRNQATGNSQLSLGKVNKYENRFDQEEIGQRRSSENTQNGDALYHDDIQHLVTHELGSLPTFFLREDSVSTDLTHNELQHINNQSELPQLDTQLSYLLNSFEFFEFDTNVHDGSNYHVEDNYEENPLQDLEEQFFSKFDEEYFEDFDEDFENINDFEDWLVIDSEILFQRDGIALVNCYAMPFYFWDIVLESFLLYELEGYVPSVKALIERLKNITSG